MKLMGSMKLVPVGGIWTQVIEACLGLVGEFPWPKLTFTLIEIMLMLGVGRTKWTK